MVSSGQERTQPARQKWRVSLLYCYTPSMIESNTQEIDITSELQRTLEEKICYFESGCIVYRHSAALGDRIECLKEIDKTLDEANELRRHLGLLAI